jgi:predicted O-linked N-acetylglucosamine transferase (SPINDLY family)
VRLKRHAEAIADFERAVSLRPDLPYVRGDLVHAKLHCCQWISLDQHVAKIVEGVRSSRSSDWPHSFIAISASPRDQLACAQQYVGDRCRPATVPVWDGTKYQHDRIRVAYLSADFREHPVAFLSAGLFETHDRSRFHTVALSLAHDRSSHMRARLQSAFDEFIDVDGKSDAEVASLIRKKEIGIVVDLMGFTLRNRMEILAQRAAPIQVNYLGFPGTTGAPYIDYVLADGTVAPFSEQDAFSEHIVHLPNCYQVNDRKRPVAARVPTRSEVGLPEQGFVFCCFNSSFKITRAVFDVWMRLLKDTDRSVLWLLGTNELAAGNLRREATARGVDEERLVFASRVNHADHLARHRLADVFLDTLPYNAHTTGSDALWAGVPLLTCKGSTFAGRVGASLLFAAGLPELVTESLEEYESRALQLVRNPAKLKALRERLRANRLMCPLFDTERSCRHIEAAYTNMWQRFQRGEPPSNFRVGSD